MKMIAWDECLAVSANKADVAREILALFIAELPTTGNEIQTHWQQRHFKQLSAVVHRLLGGCCYTGVPSLKSSAKQLMAKLSLGNEDLETEVQQILTQINQLIDEYQLVKGNL